MAKSAEEKLKEAEKEAEEAKERADAAEKENAKLKAALEKANASGKAEGIEVYVFPGDDAIVMHTVTYKGGLKDGEGKDRPVISVRICGRNIALKKDVPVLMSRSCQIVLGKIKQVKVERRNMA